MFSSCPHPYQPIIILSSQASFSSVFISLSSSCSYQTIFSSCPHQIFLFMSSSDIFCPVFIRHSSSFLIILSSPCHHQTFLVSSSLDFPVLIGVYPSSCPHLHPVLVPLLSSPCPLQPAHLLSLYFSRRVIVRLSSFLL